MTDRDTDEGVRSRISIRRILSVVGLLLLIVLVLPFVIYAAPQVVGAEHSYVVLSGSMEPTISPGDVVVVEELSREEIQTGDAISEGDVITFLREGDDRPTTHRVVDIVEQGGGVAFETKGDNNEGVDQGLVTASQVQGKIPTVAGSLFVIPYVGRVILFAGTTLGFVLLVAVPITLLIVSEIYTLVRSSTDSDARSDAESSESTETATPDEVVETTILWGDADSTDAAGTGLSVAGRDTATTHAGVSTRPETNGHSTRTIVIDTSPIGDTDDGGPVTFTAPELELGIIALAGFLAYSGWIAYSTLTTWSFAVAGSVGAAFLLLSILYLSGRLGGGTSADTGPTTTETRVVVESSALYEQFGRGKATADALRAATGISSPERIDAGEPTDAESTGLTADGSGRVHSRTEEGVNDD